MGRVLFIRVSAATYDEKDVLGAWPMLYAAVWPDPGVDGADSPARIVRKYVPAPGRGALELVDGLVDLARFGPLPEGWKEALRAPADRLEKLRRGMDEALGDQNVQAARSLAGDIENALDDAERRVRDLPGAS